MAKLNLKTLVGKLNVVCQHALEGAAGLCLSRTNYNVEIEHWFLKMLENADNDLNCIFSYYGVDLSHLKSDLTQNLEQLKTGNGRAPALSQNVVDLMSQSWLLASLEYEATEIRSGYLIYALLKDDALNRLAGSISRELLKISTESLRVELPNIVVNSSESKLSPKIQTAPGTGIPVIGKKTKTTALDKFTIDLTEEARRGKIDPVLCRDTEIRQLIDILTRRRQNNPILVGEAGVGKTAIVEGFALKIIAGDVPPSLKKVSLRNLDLGLLQAGAGIKGEFENRLKSVINEVKSSSYPIILFIDEAHTIIGAGDQAGQGDAANLLKPALARGELRTIAATTWKEYKKYFEKDAALTRRFQVVKVLEPSENDAIDMMRGLLKNLESYHKVRILDEGLIQSVRLSSRYLTGRQLPDKSVSLLDTACARISIEQTTTPSAIEDCQREIDQLELDQQILNRERISNVKKEGDIGAIDYNKRIKELSLTEKEKKTNLSVLQDKWKDEITLVKKIHEIRQQLEKKCDRGEKSSKQNDKISEADKEKNKKDCRLLRKKLQTLLLKLTKKQAANPLVRDYVDGDVVAEIVADWTGIPVGRMVKNELDTILSIKRNLGERIIGQSQALEAIENSIQTSRAKLTDPRKPIGVFLFIGTSGVGKTEAALALADLLYGGEQNITTINMSEFKEEHKISTLSGAPPGYVGYGEGGVLTEAVRRSPYSIVLFDEMEKAHPGVQDVFYQVFDKGIMRDGEGRDIDFRNTIIIMTSNAGSDLITKLCEDPETQPDVKGLTEALRPELLKIFKPAFLGRVSIIPFFPLDNKSMKQIVKLQLGRIQKRIEENYQAKMDYNIKLIENIADRCMEVETGARNIDHILTGTLLPELSVEFLSRMEEGKNINNIYVSMDKKGDFTYEVS